MFSPSANSKANGKANSKANSNTTSKATSKAASSIQSKFKQAGLSRARQPAKREGPSAIPTRN